MWQVPDAGRAGPVRHGDVGPWNAIFRGGEFVGFIDWDFAAPTPELRDLAQAAWCYVPLRPPDRGCPGCGFPAEPDLRARLGRLCSAYGAEVSAVVDQLADYSTTNRQESRSLARKAATRGRCSSSAETSRRSAARSAGYANAPATFNSSVRHIDRFCRKSGS